MDLQGLSRKEIARRTGVSLSHISRIMSGQRRPSFETGVIIAEAMGITPRDLLDRLKGMEDGRV